MLAFPLRVHPLLRVKLVLAASAMTLTTFTQQVCTALSTKYLLMGSGCSLVTDVEPLLKAFVALQVIDIITGVLASRKRGDTVGSHRLGQGLQKKFMMLLIIATAALFDLALAKEYHIGAERFLYHWTVSWYIAVEGLSIYENADVLGVPLPPFLKKALNWALQRSENLSLASAVAGVAEVTAESPTEEKKP